MNIGVNFFGPKKNLYYDFDGTLERLKDAGITSAELCVSFKGNIEPPAGLDVIIPPDALKELSGGIWMYEDAAEKIEKVRSHGLEVISTHMFGDNASPESFISVLPRVKAFGMENNIKCFVISLMQNYEGMRSFVPVMKKFSEELAEVGIMLAYHNHEMKFDTVHGQTALDYLLTECPLIKLEPDIGWAKFAGVDPVEFIKQYKDRIVLLHFKDITADACQANRDSCFTAVGEGSVPLAAVLEAAKECPILDQGLIIDQDDSLTDIIDDLAVGVKNISDALLCCGK